MAKFVIEINKKWCKGCGLCVAICPKQVLTISQEERKAKVVSVEACIGCFQCELHCPDFAISVNKLTDSGLGITIK